MGFWTQLQARRQDNRGRGWPSPQPSPCSSHLWLWPSLCPEESAAQARASPAFKSKFRLPSSRPTNNCILTTCPGGTWAPGGRPALALGAGVPGSRCSEHSLEGAGLQVATPPGPSWWPVPGEGATAGGRSRASKPALLWPYCEQDSPGIQRFWVSGSEVETRFRVLTAPQASQCYWSTGCT